MQASVQRILDTSWAFLPNLAAATAILVGGWVVARILAAVTRAALRRTDVDDRLSTWIRGDRDQAVPIERLGAQAVFYVAMLFVVIGVLQALRLEVVTEPLNALLTQLSEFAPRVLGAAGLLAVAWVVATALRRLLSGAMSAANLDERLGETAREGGDSLPLSRSLADAVYWLVFLLFLPGILGALSIDGLLQPVQGLIDQILSFVPNLFAAVLVLAVGWFVARLIQRVVTNLLAAAGADVLPARLGFELGQARLSHLLGLMLYILVLIPVVIASLNALRLDAITNPASAMLATILNSIPGLFAAGLLLAIAYAVGHLVSAMITNVLTGAGFDGLLAKLGFKGTDLPGARSLSEIVGSLTLLAVMIFASVEAANMVGFSSLAGVLVGLVDFGGQVLLGLVVFGVGLWLSNLAAGTVRESGVAQAETLAVVSRVSILALAGSMALRQMGLGDRIIELAFGLTLGAVAVAAALAFGLGGREAAAEQMSAWRHRSEG